MKICFVWIEKFRNLENVGFNLASDIKFNYENETNRIKITDRTEILEDFFGDGIVDVTGVIGKNGSGKSNTLELLCKILKESKTAIDSDFIVITKEENTYTCHYSFKEREAPILPNSDSFLAEKYSGSIQNLRVVFFSNINDGRRNNFGKNIADISANSPQRYTSNDYSARDFLKQFEFTQFDIFKKLAIPAPERITITHQLWTKPTPVRMDTVSKKMLKELKTLMRSRIKDLTPKNKLAQIIKLGIFLDIYTSFLFPEESKNDENSLPNILFRFVDFCKTNSEGTDRITSKLINIIDDFLQKQNTNTSAKKVRKKDHLINAIKIVDDIIKNLGSLQYAYKNEGSRQQELEIFTFDCNQSQFDIFADNAFDYLNASPRFEIDWLGISSGHKAYINLFSSIHDAIKGYRYDHIFLCIDEGDLYLHPMWQVEFFNKLRKTLPEMTKGSIQLILTSHSPFLVSDLPSQSLVILDNNKVINNIDVSGNKETEFLYNGDQPPLEGRHEAAPKNNTFGGNLYNIFELSFFLGEKRTSDFAYQKISEWYSLANSDTLSQEKIHELKDFAKIVGDDLTRYSLTKKISHLESSIKNAVTSKDETVQKGNKE